MIKRNVPAKKSYRPFESMWQFLILLLCLGTCLFAADIWSMLRGMDSQWASLCDTVSKAYQRGGAEEFRSELEMLEEGMGLHISLIGADGRDLISREDKSALLSSRRSRTGWPHR